MIVSSNDIELLRSLMSKWCEKKQNTLYQLADKTGLNYKTVSNIAKGVTKNPHFSNIVRILIAIEAPQEEINRFSQDAFGDNDLVSTVFTKEPNHQHAISMLKFGKKIENFVTCSTTYEIITLLANRPYEAEEIQNEYGKKGLRVIQELVEAEIALKNDNGTFFVNDFHLPTEAIKTCVKHQLNHCDQESLVDRSASLLNFTIRCTMDELMKLNEDVRAFTFKRLKEIPNTGDIDAFFSVLVGQFKIGEKQNEEI